MSNKRTIPAKDADFNVWQGIISKAAADNRRAWQLDENWLDTVFEPARAAWVEAWAAYENPNMRAPLIVAAKKSTRVTYEKLLSVLVTNLRSNTRLTDEDRLAAGIPLHDTKPTPSPVPVSYPVATIDTSMIRRLTINFRDGSSTAATAAKPKGVHGAEIRWLMCEEKPLVEALSNLAFDTRTPYTLEFEDAQRGKTVWICLRWENTRGEKGPWGEVISAIVP